MQQSRGGGNFPGYGMDTLMGYGNFNGIYHPGCVVDPLP